MRISKHDKYTAFGVTRTISEWATHLGVSYTCIRQRLNRGCSIEAALGTRRFPGPKGGRRDTFRFEYQGRRWTLLELSVEFKISKWTLDSRIRKGMSLHDAVTTPTMGVHTLFQVWNRKVDEGILVYQINMMNKIKNYPAYIRACRMIDYRMVGRFYKEFKAADEQNHLQVA